MSSSNVYRLDNDYFSTLDKAFALLANKQVYRHTPEPWFLQPKQYLANSLLTSTPLSIICYWGISPRGCVSDAEKNAFEFLVNNINKLAEVLRTKWSIESILTDTHGLLNGISMTTIDSYCKSVVNTFSQNRLRFRRMTELLGIECSVIEVLTLSSEITRQRDLFKSVPQYIINDLVTNARNHSMGDMPDIAAKNYVAISHIEAPIVRQKYSGSLQLTYQPPHMAWILPALPTLHIYVGEHHERRRPWFDCGREFVNHEK